MKKSYLTFTLSLITSLFILSCNKESTKIEITKIEPDTELINSIIDSFNEGIEESIKNNNEQDFNVVEYNFVKNIQLKNTSLDFSNKSERDNFSNEYLNFSKLFISSLDFSTQYNYIKSLNTLSFKVNNSELTYNEKQSLINKIALMKSFVSMIEKLNDKYLYSKELSILKEEECDGWWACWGKCVAGTVGSSLAAATAGALGPAATCTLVVPLIGTVACGTVGGIIGGVSGALTGAATFCD